MKIGIITQPLHTNYGGLLQNYALQQVLIKLGHEVYTIDKTIASVYTQKTHNRIIWNIKRIILKTIGKAHSPSYKEDKYIKKLCHYFTKNKIITTPQFLTQEELQKITENYQFKCYIAGSDQVWRPCYSENIYNDFLDFCQHKQGVKRIAYAASFGVDSWDFNEEQTKECSRLAKLFDAISVREDSGIALCKEHLGVDAVHLLDPTMLLEKEEYIKLAHDAGEQESDGDLFCYILDNNPQIEQAIKDIETKQSLYSFQVKAKNTSPTLRRGEDIKDHIIPSPTKWLRAFMDAKMVFTDSFHGCVFSIIFNKPFWVIGNKERGNARFDSLLKIFNLQARLISLDDINKTDLTLPINWEEVNSIKKEWQEKSFNFLKNNL